MFVLSGASNVIAAADLHKMRAKEDRNVDSDDEHLTAQVQLAAQLDPNVARAITYGLLEDQIGTFDFQAQKRLTILGARDNADGSIAPDYATPRSNTSGTHAMTGEAHHTLGSYGRHALHPQIGVMEANGANPPAAPNGSPDSNVDSKQLVLNQQLHQQTQQLTPRQHCRTQSSPTPGYLSSVTEHKALTSTLGLPTQQQNHVKPFAQGRERRPSYLSFCTYSTRSTPTPSGAALSSEHGDFIDDDAAAAEEDPTALMMTESEPGKAGHDQGHCHIRMS